jgi:S-adenosylmethionine:tRNA ribosyltransferase-isomerase
MTHLDLDHYKYTLPESKIAKFPLSKRDQSKLLFYNQGVVTHHKFPDITSLLPPESLLVFNETRVIPARLTFHKKTGAVIEIMLLNPIAPSTDINIAMSATRKFTWVCMIKNLRKWKQENVLEESITIGNKNIILTARLINKEKQHVQLEWERDGLSFSEILGFTGKVPIPPYLKREPILQDKVRYQTVYSKNKGAVAAPTAGLHFTKKIIDDIAAKNHVTDYITLHVSAGTFQPIQEKDIKSHNMHTESIVINKSNIRNLTNNLGNIIAVGTTSMRTLESIYWFGVKLLLPKEEHFFIDKLIPYNQTRINLPSPVEALHAVNNHMGNMKTKEIHGETQIFIFPGYDFKICNGLITNYHMPGSTLMLLVAAFVGDDWKKIYDEALKSNYRFLSYGDSSFIRPRKPK